MKKALVLGASGFIGNAICKELRDEWEVYGTYYSNRPLLDDTMMMKWDLKNSEQLLNILKTVEPDVVISSLRGDYLYQIEAHRIMADYLNTHGVRLFYLSSANVFDGVTAKPHGESDLVCSNSDYGKFKIKCETLLHELMGPLVTIIRLPMVFGVTSSRTDTIKDEIRKNGTLPIYSDFYISVHSDKCLAKQLAYLIKTDTEGIIHLTSQDVIAYKTAMSMFLKLLGYDHLPFRYERIQEQPYYLALKTEKNLLPVELIYSAEQIMSE